MVCITLFQASNCIFSVSPSRKEEREALEFFRSPENEHLQIVRNVILCVSTLERYYKRHFLHNNVALIN